MPYLLGEVKIMIKGTDSPVVKLGMALSGISVIEFPDTDRFFAIHPPENGDWIRVEKSPSMKGDHHLVLRAGPDLMKEKAPAASVAIQMESGLNVVLWIYPATSVIYQTHRCVFSYNRAEVISARRAAGLAVNLGKDEEEVKAAAQVLPAVAEATSLPTATPKVDPTSVPAKTADRPVTTGGTDQSKMEMLPGMTDQAGAETPEQTAVKNGMESALSQFKLFKKWSPPSHGLSVSTRAYDLDESTRIVAIAVRNMENQMLRIMPGHPELVIETTNDKGKVVQLSQVKKLAEETNSRNQVIPARGTIVYVIAFRPPILSTKQKLRITIGQQNAADAPAASDLTFRRSEK
ncbi:MAG TPA: hypothetical protein VJ302_36920 [Blastocatellia bacterium]|nr:hypothetical protein [Blastocatellia bacterium]